MPRKLYTWPHEININNKENKYEWSSQSLFDSFYPLYEDLMKNPSSFAFRDEVNPNQMGIPEYKTIIKQPMSLNTIRQKLISKSYEEPWDIVNDFWLIFNNAMLFNKPSTNVYKECVKLLDYFKEKVNKLMKKLGFCCGMKYSFEPQTLACNLCDPTNPVCAIWKGDPYYFFKESEEEPIQICKLCFDKSPESFLVPTDTPKVCHKGQFKCAKNDILTEENFIPCSKCCRNWHTICSVHISTAENPFLCDMCNVSQKVVSKEFTAERIPSTDLSEFIEERVNLKFHDKEIEMNKVIVRVLADTSLEVRIKPEIVEHYKDRTVSSLPYQSKAIYVFQNIDGCDILFFALYTQEYGENCPSPNTKRVYISYLDSVHYFRPAEYRTEVYHEILMSYLEYCRRQQYLTAHLWACPPGSGDDYVFHQHPSEQKVPKRNRLINWYKSMLNQAVLSDIVIEYMNIHEFLLENKIDNPVDIPYFEGDFWPNAIAEMLVTDEQDPSNEPHQKKRKLSKKKIDSTKDLRARMLQLTKKFNEEFLVVVLNRVEEVTSSTMIVSKSFSLKNTTMFEQRDSLLYFCREYNLEFSSLRRAKFTTMRILDELFRENQKESFDCDVCKKSNLSDRYTCIQCLDFDLCPICYDKTGHQHSMERVFQKSEEITLGDMLKLLNEAIRCKGCRSNRCVMMKLLLVHAQKCTLSYEVCADCYRFTLLMVNHAHYCRDDNCRIAFCREKREKDKRKESQRLLKQQYNEILRYQATKRNSENDDTKIKSESTEIVSLDDLYKMLNQFKKDFPEKNECRRQIFSFMEKNAGYQQMWEKHNKMRSECKQLGKQGNKSLNPQEVSIPSTITKEKAAPVVRQKSSYFIEPLPGNTAIPVIYKTKVEVKPPPVPLIPQNQPTVKKRVQISHQN